METPCPYVSIYRAAKKKSASKKLHLTSDFHNVCRTSQPVRRSRCIIAAACAHGTSRKELLRWLGLFFDMARERPDGDGEKDGLDRLLKDESS